jgi:PhnB protein
MIPARIANRLGKSNLGRGFLPLTQGRVHVPLPAIRGIVEGNIDQPMGNILHDWNLEKKKVLIRKAYDALPQGGAFIALENLIDDARREALDGKVGHAEISVGDSRIMLGDTCEESPARDPQALGSSSVGLHLYVEDVDVLFAQAVVAGAKVIKPVQDQFYGDRNGTLQDPFRHIRFVSTHKEDLTPEEINRHAEVLFGQGNS